MSEYELYYYYYYYLKCQCINIAIIYCPFQFNYYSSIEISIYVQNFKTKGSSIQYS